MLVRTIAVLLSLVCTLVSNLYLSANADYYIPPPKAKYFVLVQNWLLKPGASGEIKTLSGSVKGTSKTWEIDYFLLADSTDSNTICTGSYKEAMRKYLNSLQSLDSKTEMLVQVVQKRTNSPLVVASISPYDKTKSWEREKQFGSAVLNMSPEQIKGLGSADAYNKKVAAICAANATAIAGLSIK